MGALAARRVAIPAQEIPARILAGLQHDDERVQSAALWTLASRAAGPRFSKEPQVAQDWAAERPLLTPLRALAVDMVRSPNPRVRHAAFAAIGNMDYQLGQPGALRLGADTLNIILIAFPSESEPSLRAEMVKAIALDAYAVAGRPLLISALSDRDPYVVRMAATGIGEHRLTEQMPALATLLNHQASIVRLAVAGAFSVFGRAAVPYLAALKDAAARETDWVTEQTLRGTIGLIEKAG